jgi:hypothetical protein
MGRWRQEESGRVRTPLEPVVLVATLALIPVLIIESDAKSETWQRVAEVANWVIWAVFAVELAAILIVASRRKAALRAHWLDVAIVVLTVPLVTEALAWLRLARFIRLARIGALATRAIQSERRLGSGDSLRIALILTLTAIVVGGAAESAASDDSADLRRTASASSRSAGVAADAIPRGSRPRGHCFVAPAVLATGDSTPEPHS